MNVSGVTAGGNILTVNGYNDNNGMLNMTRYGNNDTVEYSYDSLDRVTQKLYTDTDKNTNVTYTWEYNANNRIAKFSDSSEGRNYNYTYDLSGRLIEMYRDDGAYIRTDYDTKNLSTGISYSFGGITESVAYLYNESMDNAPQRATFTDGSLYNTIYDALGRKSVDGIMVDSSFIYGIGYSYLDNASDSSKTSSLVSNLTYSLVDGLSDLEYEYDSRRNITKITKGGEVTETYIDNQDNQGTVL